ncbi:conserved hypothetical protein, partial [Ricinus communis]
MNLAKPTCFRSGYQCACRCFKNIDNAGRCECARAAGSARLSLCPRRTVCALGRGASARQGAREMYLSGRHRLGSAPSPHSPTAHWRRRPHVTYVSPTLVRLNSIRTTGHSIHGARRAVDKTPRPGIGDIFYRPRGATRGTMTVIPLNRRFVEWHDESRDPALHLRYSSPESGLTWHDLHQRRRVVILAEAGSGKSVELEQRARELSMAGKFAFYATVQDVGRDGLDRALGRSAKQQLDAWRQSDQSGWFFVDSIDEAKLDNVRLDRALRQIATDIFRNEGRAFIVLSGRHTDWEFARDARRLQDELPIPVAEPTEPPPPLRTLIRWILRSEKRPEAEPVETPVVVVMAPLDDAQIRIYAAAKGVNDIQRFVAAIRSGNLLDIARRPLDLDWL